MRARDIQRAETNDADEGVTVNNLTAIKWRDRCAYRNSGLDADAAVALIAAYSDDEGASTATTTEL
jgi:hypothetical protein